MKFDIIENKENEDGSFSFEVDYDREFKKHFEKTYNKRLTKKSLTEFVLKTIKESTKI
jgi:hypothetical protein|tara:strand:- start:27 stop:200 length:174 start_codon:yes stop_codon:yes gene_type:complete